MPTGKQWTKFEEKHLSKIFTARIKSGSPRWTVEEIAKSLHRPIGSIRTRACLLGLRRPPFYSPYCTKGD